MIYKEFQDLKLSALGFGTMRLPTIDGNDSKIDEKAAAEMFDYAIRNGVNYFDTAWGYHDGNSEIVTGKILAGYPRDSFYLASKFPGYDLSNIGKVREIFEAQLNKCRVDHFDFYLFHNVYEKNIDPYLDEKNGILEYLLYLDWNFQDAKAKVELLNERKIPIWVMEPVRGGRLANLPEEAEKQLRELRPDEKTPAWAFRFLQSVPGVTMVLSGMTSLQQVKDNIDTFAEERPLSQQEFDTIVSIADGMVKGGVLPCTACHYCTSHCPMHLDIPRLLALYNEHIFTGGGFIAPMAIDALPDNKKPSACIACRSCEAVCPQQIKISQAMADFSHKLGLK